MQEEKLTQSLVQNKLLMKGLFGAATDFYTKDVCLGGVRCCI